jgi:hypothetical protein
MSAALVSDPIVPQTLVDDLESAFYFILWLVLMYTDSSMMAREHTTIMQHVMDPQPVEGMGGHGKADFLQGQGVLQQLTLENPDQSWLKMLLIDLATLFSVCYKAVPTPNDWDLLDGLDSAKWERMAAQKYEIHMKHLKSHKHIIQLISNAILDASQWPTDDCAVLKKLITPDDMKKRKITKTGWGVESQLDR